uniref:Uncharacterized protein n=1 Tax=Cacopsylla melanoneura TaxID=428564 RepID=A0A8D8LN80_9HEMI
MIFLHFNPNILIFSRRDGNPPPYCHNEGKSVCAEHIPYAVPLPRSQVPLSASFYSFCTFTGLQKFFSICGVLNWFGKFPLENDQFSFGSESVGTGNTFSFLSLK